MMKSIFLVGTGGFLGSVSRFLASKYVQDAFLSAFPYGTFFVNIVGSFLIGIIFGLTQKFDIASEYRLFLATGFCGGFTTFSTFANENILLLKDSEVLIAFLYTALSIIIGFSAAYGGALFTKLF